MLLSNWTGERRGEGDVGAQEGTAPTRLLSSPNPRFLSSLDPGSTPGCSRGTYLSMSATTRRWRSQEGQSTPSSRRLSVTCTVPPRRSTDATDGVESIVCICSRSSALERSQWIPNNLDARNMLSPPASLSRNTPSTAYNSMVSSTKHLKTRLPGYKTIEFSTSAILLLDTSRPLETTPHDSSTRPINTNDDVTTMPTARLIACSYIPSVYSPPVSILSLFLPSPESAKYRRRTSNLLLRPLILR